MGVATLHAVTAGEVGVVRALAEAIWPAAYGAILAPGQIAYMLERMYSEQQLRADLAAGVRYTLLREDGAAIGFAAFGPGESRGAAKLHKLYVLPERQRRGFGSLLLRHVVEAAAAGGFKSLTLQVNRHNGAAIAAYQRNGFAITSERVTDIGGGYVMDDFLMTRALP